MGLRTGPIQEGSQPGPRLDRKARAGKDPKAHGGFKAKQACTMMSAIVRVRQQAPTRMTCHILKPWQWSTMWSDDTVIGQIVLYDMLIYYD